MFYYAIHWPHGIHKDRVTGKFDVNPGSHHRLHHGFSIYSSCGKWWIIRIGVSLCLLFYFLLSALRLYYAGISQNDCTNR